ncbi:hypothetical protein [Peptoniphilus stercorisuis]|uniref:Uncharacterized protein n=1 Tax=Peptoniphilus stercorisuis TaxID=1436965 RepID=A0ABS4KCS7_9FIRM|nr:hypothetical protein [Peptoniphilus stercorisuis]MBP2025562.1 hypothetical protein [Peptoniphilus stercorisuis]
MFIKKYLNKILIIVSVVTILLGNIIITPTLAKKVDVQNVSVEAKNVLGIQIAFNIVNNKHTFKKGDTIDYYFVYPRENIDNNQFDLYFFNANPILNELKNNFDIKYFISKDESLEKDIENIKKFNYEEIKYD